MDHIEVWYDETSDYDDPKWVVSLCRDDGGEIRCLSTHEDEDEALTAGEVEAAKRGLDACERDEHGHVSTYAQFDA